MHKRKDVIPNNLKEYRKKCGYTQKEVAKFFGFSNEVAISHWEQGVNIPNLINLFKLSALYRTSPSELYASLASEIKESITLDS